MKIALVSEHASPLASLGGVDAGGQNVYVAELARALGARGHAVTVYTRRDDRRTPARVAFSRGVDVVHVDAGPPETLPKDTLLPYMVPFGRALAAMWDGAPPDVVHSHFWMSGVATRIAARRHGVAWTHTYHALGAEKLRFQGSGDTSPHERIGCEREILRDADVIAATSSAEVFEHRRTGGGRELKLIPCGVALEQFDACDAGGPDDRDARYRIATLSRLVPRKGVDTVIRALASLPDTELVVGGGENAADPADDCDVRRLVALAHDTGVADRVRFSGPVARADVGKFLLSSDAVVCVPLYEPFGLVPLEAMACRRPAIVSHVGGLVDTVVDGVTGFHVPPADPAALARVLAAVLPDAVLRAQLGAAGRKRAERSYAWSQIAERLENVYLGLAVPRRELRETTG